MFRVSGSGLREKADGAQSARRDIAQIQASSAHDPSKLSSDLAECHEPLQVRNDDDSVTPATISSIEVRTEDAWGMPTSDVRQLSPAGRPWARFWGLRGGMHHDGRATTKSSTSGHRVHIAIFPPHAACGRRLRPAHLAPCQVVVPSSAAFVAAWAATTAWRRAASIHRQYLLSVE